MDNREIDALVAEKVMGWKASDRCEMEDCAEVHDATCHAPKFYSTNISDAWEVVEKMAELGYPLRIERGNLADLGYYLVSFEPAGWDWVYTSGMICEAICYSALKAMGVKI